MGLEWEKKKKEMESSHREDNVPQTASPSAPSFDMSAILIHLVLKVGLNKENGRGRSPSPLPGKCVRGGPRVFALFEPESLRLYVTRPITFPSLEWGHTRSKICAHGVNIEMKPS